MGSKLAIQFFFLIHATFWGGYTSFIQDWAVFVDPNGYFEVLMPDSTLTQSTTITTALGELEYVSIASEEVFDGGEVQYVLSYCDYPEGLFHPDSTELINLFFDETIRGALESVSAELVYSDDHKDTFYPARLWKMTSEKLGKDYKSKALLVRDRYYLLQVTYPSTISVSLNKADEFFNSFNVKKE